MSLVRDQLPLKIPSPQGWLDAVMSDFDAFLIDHATCERKASGLAMSFVAKYADRSFLVEPMISLAREELAHFHEVYKLMSKRGLQLAVSDKDPYVSALLKNARHGPEEHFLDRLIISGVVEARGCERFYMVGEALSQLPGEVELGAYYTRLGREEAGHFKIFLKIARHYFPEDIVRQRTEDILEREAEAMLAVPFRPAVH